MLERWLENLCASLPGTRRAAVFTLAENAPEPEPVSAWPDRDSIEDDLLNCARLASARSGTVTTAGQADGEPILMMARQLAPGPDARVQRVLAIEFRAGTAQQAALSQLLEWAERWLPLIEAQPARAGDEPDLMTLLASNDVDAGLTAWATDLSRRGPLERVFVGRRRGDRVRMAAISGSVNFDSRAALLQSIEDVMNLEDGPEVLVEGPALDALSLDFGLGAPALWLLTHGGVVEGAVLLEKSTTGPFDAGFLAEVGRLVTPLAALLAWRRRADASWWDRAARDLRERVAGIVGPKYLPLKLAVVAALAATFLLALLPGEYEVRADARVEGSVQRAVVAPFAGFVKNQFARAGDVVAEGAVIAELDSEELSIELRELLAEKSSVESDYRKALADVDQVTAGALAADLRRVDARIELLEVRLARTRLLAPMSGVVISGDLSRSLGAPVDRGEVLFVVAPPDDFRLAIAVPEAFVTDVALGQEGTLVLDALVESRIAFNVVRIAGAEPADDGSTRFRIEAELGPDAPPGVRPGMTGTARIAAGERSLLLIYTRQLTDWLRRAAFRWLP